MAARDPDDVIFDSFVNEFNASLGESEDVQRISIAPNARRDIKRIASQKGVSIRAFLDEMFGTQTMLVMDDETFQRLMAEQKPDPFAGISLRGKPN